ncbi:MAG: cysteine--tRNA ligase [Candidatus Hodarchaeota archaeon]
MVLRVFNTLTRKKEVFKPIHKGEVRIYTCGPTVYSTPHIGNYRSFLMGDLIRRYLEYIGYKVKHVMNITDIDDKTIRDSRQEGLPLKEFTEKYTKEFFNGLDMLNIKRAQHYPKATEHVQDMIKIVRELVKKGYAYEKSGSVYFDISKFKDYGKLSKIDLSEIKIGARADVDEYDKENPQDFALLKKSTPEELKREIYYETEWGNVRPGWHIECSALAMKFLGETLDIHTGGVDLIFPHHENEIAQSEAYTKKHFVKYWMHGEHLLVNGRKMSKSLGNYITLEDVIEKFSSEVVRYMFVSTHYRKKLNYTKKLAANAKRNYDKLKETFDRINFFMKNADTGMTESEEAFLNQLTAIEKRFVKAMDNDLNTPLALKVFHELAKEINKYLEKRRNKDALKRALESFKRFSQVFGLEFEDVMKELQVEIEELIKKREEARKRKDWKTADKIRDKLRTMGVTLQDTPVGVRWKIEKNNDIRD